MFNPEAGPRNPEEESKESALEKINAAPNTRQQNKILKILETGDFDILNQGSVEISAEERSGILERIRSGEISEDALRKVVHEVRPIYKEEGFKDKLSEIHGNEGRQDTIIKTFVSLFGKPGGKQPPFNVGVQWIIEDCPTVDLLQDKVDGLVVAAKKRLEDPSLNATEREMAKRGFISAKQIREEDFDEFALLFYGKQKQYWDQVRLLKQEALGQ